MEKIIKHNKVLSRPANMFSRSGGFSKGFTLIELIVVLVIIGIFAAFAIPSYQQYARRADASMAQQEMQKISEQLERHKAKNFTYRGFNPNFLYGQSSIMSEVTLPRGASGSRIKYTITIRDGDDPAKLLTAVDASTPPKPDVRGRMWVMKAETSDVKNYNFLMSSTGIRCKNKAKELLEYKNSDTKEASCGDITTGREDW
ncbi:prepilin-type N-terminal cleavage/methylation domain-containing protein [Acinetobacter sp. NS-4]|uniref:type IV pilin protein n=1 Tax=Acinetobacter sp. NS-4 TaxID=3127956 RepID=UPI00307DB0BE